MSLPPSFYETFIQRFFLPLNIISKIYTIVAKTISFFSLQTIANEGIRLLKFNDHLFAGQSYTRMIKNLNVVSKNHNIQIY